MQESEQAGEPVAVNAIQSEAEAMDLRKEKPLRSWVRVLLLALAPVLTAAVLWLLSFAGRTALAAVVLEYFNAIASPSAVLLEWSTLSEYNLRGFEILCKMESEPDAAYHRIGYFNPKGNATQGAQYDMLVTDLQPGQTYCFRLVELTTDETPGEVRDRCGYGLGISPTSLQATTPATTPTVTSAPGVTPTVVLFPTPVLPPGITPTPNPLGASPLAAPNGESPLAPPFGESPLEAPTGQSPDDIGAASAQPLPTDDPFAAPKSGPDVQSPLDPSATVTPAAGPESPLGMQTTAPIAEAPPATETPAAGDLAVAQAPAADAAQAPPPPSEPVAAPTGDPTPTPTSLYVIVTATPIPAVSNIVAASAVTPWPTATPPASLFASFATPTAQNLTVMLLCFIFLTASALGGLGLVTSVLWMRSRTQRDLDAAELRARLQRERRRLP